MYSGYNNPMNALPNGGKPAPSLSPVMMPPGQGLTPMPSYEYSSMGGYPAPYYPPQPMMYNTPTVMFPGPMSPYPPSGSVVYASPPAPHSYPPSPIQPEPEKPIEEIKKGKLYATLGAEGSQAFFCVLTSDGKLAFHAGEKPTNKPKDTFNISVKSELKLDGGSLAILREDGASVVLNALSISGIKDWYDAVRDLQKDLKHMPQQHKPLSISAPTGSPQTLSPSQSHVRRNSAEVPMNYDSELIPVPPRPKHSTLKGVSHTSSNRGEKSNSAPLLPTEKNHSPSHRHAGTVRLATPPSEEKIGTPPRPHMKQARLKRSSSMNNKTGQELTKISSRRNTDTPATTSKEDVEENKTDEQAPGKSPRELDDERAKTQGAVRPKAEGPSVEDLMKEIQQLKAKNEQLEKALVKTNDSKQAGPVQVAGVWSTISIDFRKDHVEYHERLGGGGSGATVFRCSVKGFSFAAKILSTAYHQPEEIEPLLREISIMTRLQHDNIVRYLGSEATSSEIRLFMELYSGTLRDVIESCTSQKRTFSKKDVTNYIFQITKGLNYLHTQDPPVIHRDLKSDNIFVTWDGQRNPKNLRIGDFDVSKVMSAGKMAFTQNIGTPGFIAPEVFSKATPSKEVGHDTHADIWSLGMIMFELITMRRPYFEMPFLQVSEANATGSRPTIPDDVNKDEFKDLIKLFEKCTRKVPSKRPSAKRLLSMLGQM